MDYRLRVGEKAAVRPRWWGRAWSVTFAGTVGRETFSVVVQWTMGHNSAAYNLFLPMDAREFRLPVGTAEVREVSAREISFRFSA